MAWFKAGELEAKTCYVDQGVQTDPVQRETLPVNKRTQDEAVREARLLIKVWLICTFVGQDQSDSVEASVYNRPFTGPNKRSKDLKVLMKLAGEGNKRGRGVEVSVQLKRQKLGEEFAVKVVY
jgi:hypothetical protein